MTKAAKTKELKPTLTVILPRAAKDVLREVQNEIFTNTGFSVSFSQLLLVLLNEALAARGHALIPRAHPIRGEEGAHG
jgi:hypothetical protein